MSGPVAATAVLRSSFFQSGWPPGNNPFQITGAWDVVLPMIPSAIKVSELAPGPYGLDVAYPVVSTINFDELFDLSDLPIDFAIVLNIDTIFPFGVGPVTIHFTIPNNVTTAFAVPVFPINTADAVNPNMGTANVTGIAFAKIEAIL